MSTGLFKRIADLEALTIKLQGEINPGANESTLSDRVGTLEGGLKTLQDTVGTEDQPANAAAANADAAAAPSSTPGT